VSQNGKRTATTMLFDWCHQKSNSEEEKASLLPTSTETSRMKRKDAYPLTFPKAMQTAGVRSNCFPKQPNHKLQLHTFFL